MAYSPFTLPSAPSSPDHPSNVNPLDADEGDVVLLWEDGCLDKWKLTEGVEDFAQTAWGYRIDSQPVFCNAPNPVHKRSGEDKVEPQMVIPQDIAGIKPTQSS